MDVPRSGHAQEDSYIEADLADLVPSSRFVPAATPPSAPSVYGGLAHSEYHHESPQEITFSPPPASYYSSASHHSFNTNPATSPRLSSVHVPPHRSSLPPNSNDLPAFSRWSPTWVSGGYSGDGKAYTSHTPPQAAYAPSGAWAGPPGRRDQYDEEHEEECEEDGWVPEPPFVGEWEAPGGTYRHGVGYESTASLGALSSQKVADRLRRLEREFGGEKGAGAGAGVDEPVTFKERLEKARRDRKNEIGQREVDTGVDSKGRLVVQGPKKRAAARWLQGSLAFGVAFASIGASLFTHPISTPPPDKTAPLYILYILPFLSLALSTYLLLLRPCLLRSASRKASPNNHLIMPLTQSGGPSRPTPSSGWCCCASSRKQPQRWGGGGGQSVNLVIDPAMFPHLLGGGQQATPLTTESREAREKRRRRRRRRAKVAAAAAAKKEGEGDDDDLLSSGEGSSCSSDTDEEVVEDGRRAVGVGGGGAKGWKAARKTVKVFAWWDAVAGLLWAAIGAWAVAFGERCTPGAFQGWCNYYNSALALAVLVAVTFFTSFAFDCLDLRRSKDAPHGHHHHHRLQAGFV